MLSFPFVTPAFERMAASSIFSAFQALRLHQLCPASLGGLGVIFMLHRILPEQSHQKFAPQKSLAISPEFLAQTLDQLQALNIDIISLDEAHQRILSSDPRKFAVFTFDDGFQDVLKYAFPIFKQRSVPLTLYIPSAWPEGEGVLYWSLIEKIIYEEDVIINPIPDFPNRLICKTLEQKKAVFETLTQYFEKQKNPAQSPYLKTLLKTYGLNVHDFCLKEIMNWNLLRQLNQDKLVTIGSHCVTHRALNTLSDSELISELEQSRRKIEHELGQPCQHLAYPFGDLHSVESRALKAADKAGYSTAVTTRKGVVQPEHRSRLMALPRIHLHNDYQAKGYISMVTSGMPFFILNKLRHHVAP